MVNSNEESEDTIETTAPANDVVSETSMSEDDSASSTLETATTSNMGSSY